MPPPMSAGTASPVLIVVEKHNAGSAKRFVDV
jgi:hypothetical protein